ncbi:MAG: carboxypeptidase regulatory-like domain-containing protein [Planctomycetota bacterium]|nr:MAG: carboxypeptidase regulatory-like domain-containing protein [Planctomycetota bacterium]
MADGSAPPESLSLWHAYNIRLNGFRPISRYGEITTLKNETGSLPVYHGPNTYTLLASEHNQLPAQELAQLTWSFADSSSEVVSLTIDPGIEHRLVILDPDDQPIEGAEVGLRVPLGHGSTDPNRVTDGSGAITWQGLSTGIIYATISAPGHETIHGRPLALEDGPQHTVHMLAEEDVQVRLSNADGTPCLDASFELVGYYMNDMSHTRTQHPLPISSSLSSDGTFRLHQLGHSVVAIIRAVNDSGFAIFTATADQVIPVSMQPFKRLQLTVSDPEFLPLSRVDQRPYVQVSRVMNFFSGSSHSFVNSHPVILEDGQGHLELTGLWCPSVFITAGGTKLSKELRDTLTELEIAATALPEKVAPQLTPVTIAVEPAEAVNQGWLDVREAPIGENFSTHWHLPAQEVAAGFKVMAPTELRLSSRYLRGWYFSQERSVGIHPDMGAPPIKLEAIPAGLIHGQVTMPPGADGNAWVSIRIVPIADEQNDQTLPHLETISGARRDRRYLSTPVPLGASWQIRAICGMSLYFSDPISVTASQPVQQSDIVFPPGKDLTVTILQSDGRPLVGANVNLNYREDGHNISFGTITTTHDGVCVLRNINPQVPGTYGLRVAIATSDYNDHKKFRDIDISSGEITLRMGEE